jgi:hypothetical protein
MPKNESTKTSDIKAPSYYKQRALNLKISPWFIWRGVPGETSDGCPFGDPATWRTSGIRSPQIMKRWDLIESNDVSFECSVYYNILSPLLHQATSGRFLGI